MAQHNISGQKAEDLACDYLTSKKFTIIERNYRDRFCEIDIIATSKVYIIFVEVKYRARADFGGAVGAVTPAKLTRMYNSAQYWLAKHDKEIAAQPRLDVITVVGDIRQPNITHIENVR